MSNENNLTTEIKNDIDRSFERLIDKSSQKSDNELIRKATQLLEGQLQKDHPGHIIEGLKRGWDLIRKLKETSDETSKKVIHAALEYLIDPWDIIPDFIESKGFLDDIYVIDQALIRIRAISEYKSIPFEEYELTLDPEIVTRQLGGFGDHFSSRAIYLQLLNEFERKALEDISSNYRGNGEITRKQKVFYTVIIEKLIKQGIIEEPCNEQPCDHCYELKQVYEQTAS